ncbi:hypothetical protein BDV98DRAFT_592482 [Pterulicium gracile]|uniref:Uncharacterized protein n=1 Tax=Pterulicium gracile TaxID=1884261 RepID=A0A5C3QLE3_9AGAR|nr:hypothetical protein BDV98DRAFT_592482 [Pterula gracilis]
MAQCIRTETPVPQGNAVKIIGSLAAGSSYYTIQLDERPPEIFNFNASEESPNLLLYYADGIGYEDHRISLISNTDVDLGIDLFAVRGGAGSNANNASPGPRPPSFAPSPVPTATGSDNRGPGFPGSRSPGAQQHEKSRSNMSSSSDSGSSVGRAPDRSRFHARINSLGVECQSLPDVEEGRETGHTRPPMRVTNLSQGCKSEESTYLHIMSPSRTHRAASHHQHRIRRPSDASPACEFSMSPVCNTIEEDYAHLIVEGEPSPPDYWQATRGARGFLCISHIWTTAQDTLVYSISLSWQSAYTLVATSPFDRPQTRPVTYDFDGYAYQSNYGDSLNVWDVRSIARGPTGKSVCEAGYIDVYHPEYDENEGSGLF